MKVLCIADEEEKALWDYYQPGKLADIDLILSSGDLHPDYLQFLVTMASCPLAFIHGNHDDKYKRNPPLGCRCIEDEIYNFHGLRILGLGGSMRYRPGDYLYTEQEMKRRILKLAPALMMTNGFDILLAHSPAAGYGDMEDLPHRGYDCFNELLMRFRPKYMLHGHVHKAYGHFEREREHPSGALLINTCGSFVLEVSEEDHPPKGKTGSPLYDLYTRLAKQKM